MKILCLVGLEAGVHILPVVAGGVSISVSVLELSLSSFRALSGRLKCTVQRHKFGKDSLSPRPPVRLFSDPKLPERVFTVPQDWGLHYWGPCGEPGPVSAPHSTDLCRTPSVATRRDRDNTPTMSLTPKLTT